MNTGFEKLVDGIDFGEGPRWRDGALWYSDFYQQKVYRVDEAGERHVVVELDDQPSGLGWLPGGDLLVVAMKQQQVLRYDGQELRVHADLSELATGLCNDMVVGADGCAYVGCFGFDFVNGEPYAPAVVMLVDPSGQAQVAAADLAFPNGSVVTADGRTLIVGESFGGSYTAFDRRDDGTLENRRLWAEVPGMAPDGCTLDAAGGIWFSDARGAQVIRVLEGGEITHQLPIEQPTFACMLGGDDGQTLFALTAPSADPSEVAGQAAGGLWKTRVETPKAGLP